MISVLLLNYLWNLLRSAIQYLDLTLIHNYFETLSMCVSTRHHAVFGEK